jgi:hypothetical protein
MSQLGQHLNAPLDGTDMRREPIEVRQASDQLISNGVSLRP